MRAIALLLSIMLMLAPWSGAMAYAVIDGAPTQTEMTDAADHPAPCHIEQPQANPGCDNCGHNSCDMGECQQCANAVAGILSGGALSAPLQQRELFSEPPATTHSHQPIPESPPPIA